MRCWSTKKLCVVFWGGADWGGVSAVPSKCTVELEEPARSASSAKRVQCAGVRTVYVCACKYVLGVFYEMRH